MEVLKTQEILNYSKEYLNSWIPSTLFHHTMVWETAPLHSPQASRKPKDSGLRNIWQAQEHGWIILMKIEGSSERLPTENWSPFTPSLLPSIGNIMLPVKIKLLMRSSVRTSIVYHKIRGDIHSKHMKRRSKPSVCHLRFQVITLIIT